jgi:cobalt-precorrin 5A hydrolase
MSGRASALTGADLKLGGLHRLAIGVGCRRGCAAAAIAALVERALAIGTVSAGEQALFTTEHKRGEQGLRAAAERLGLPLYYLSDELLRAVQSRLATRSAAAERRFGIPSVAEAAALAGAGPQSVLLVPRINDNGATCAIAATMTPDAPP